MIIQKVTGLRLRTPNGSRVEQEGYVNINISIRGHIEEWVGFVVTRVPGVHLIGMNILPKFEHNEWRGVSNQVVVDEYTDIHIECSGTMFEREVGRVLREYDSLFVVKGEMFGAESIGIHKIRTRDNTPVALSYRRIIPSQVMGVK